MLASAHALHKPTAPCLSISGLNAKEFLTKGECIIQGNAKGLGVGVWLSAKHPKGNKGSCIDLTTN